MTSYDDSPPDEGYSEDPLTVGPSGALPSWMASMTVPERTGERASQQIESTYSLTSFRRVCHESDCPSAYL